MLSSKQKDVILKKIAKMEAVMNVYETSNSLGEFCLLAEQRSKQQLESKDAIAPVLRTALVINWPEKAMKRRYERFRTEFPEIDCLSKLRNVMKKTDALKFCSKYLDIRANEISPESNPKYALLKTLVDGFLEYQQDVAARTEIEALRKWANSVDLKNLHSDPIAHRRGVGPGVVENIRLNLGYHVVKPDRHVIGVMRQDLGLNIRPEAYVELADELGLSPRYFDCVLFNYGKLMSISD